MATPRTPVTDFHLANPLYANARVWVYEVDVSTWTATTTLATLYTAPSGSDQAANPQTLDSLGKWVRPIYVDRPVALRLTNAPVPAHDTGVVNIDTFFRFRGVWASDEDYLVNELIRDGVSGAATGSIYLATESHTSSGAWAADLADGKWVLYQPAASAAPTGATLNVLDFGVVGDGVADDTSGLIAALAAVPDDGGTVFIPPGLTCLFRANLRVKAGTTIYGGGTIKAMAIGNWASSPYYGITNVNNTATSITDTDITVRGITIDYRDFPSGDGTRHTIMLKRVRRVVIEDVTIYGGSSAVALLGCDDTLELNNRYYGFSNCGSDHWTSPKNARVIGCHLDTDVSAQMVNFNPENSTGPSTGNVAEGFVMTGCTLVSRESSATPCQIEPLSAGTSVRNVTITGNVFKNCEVVFRGDVDGIVFSDNIMSDFQGGAEAITCYAFHGGTPGSVVVANNIVRDPLTSGGNEAAIRIKSPKGMIFGNVVIGSAAARPWIGTTGTQIFGNYRDDGGFAAGSLNQGFYVANGQSAPIGWTDASGTHPSMFLQGDDNWIFAGTNSTGGARYIMTMYQRSDTSELIVSVPVQLSSNSRLEYSPATGIAAAGTSIGGATHLTANYNEVTSCTAGVADGVALSPDTGLPQTVFNNTSDTLKVYGNNSGVSTVDGGAVNGYVTIAPRKARTFFRFSGANFQTIAST